MHTIADRGKIVTTTGAAVTTTGAAVTTTGAAVTTTGAAVDEKTGRLICVDRTGHRLLRPPAHCLLTLAIIHYRQAANFIFSILIPAVVTSAMAVIFCILNHITGSVNAAVTGASDIFRTG
jgi:hypothetical protein